MPKPTTELPAIEVAPNPQPEKRTRRIFTHDYKLSIFSKRKPASMLS